MLFPEGTDGAIAKLAALYEKAVPSTNEYHVYHVFIYYPCSYKTLGLSRGRRRPMVKVTDSCLTCNKFEPCTAEKPPCRGGRCTSNLPRLKSPHYDVMWKYGEGGASSGVILVTLP
ncbi:hypothetical protein TNCV_4414741 [Trichonephila clavipes]|uniref:Uncharacterized protein n=1 Tax=Trichonephila clavipes TaxID=2585209 RepID=A0A8X6S9G4_TRICX|nr:hypothetical protein TNCV_4414741 [Trichonephila clavipes]